MAVIIEDTVVDTFCGGALFMDILASICATGDIGVKTDGTGHETSGKERRRLQAGGKQGVPEKDELSIPEGTSAESKESLEVIINEVNIYARK